MPISSPLASLLDTATDTALITLTADGRIGQWCPAVARLLGWTAQDWLGESIVGLLLPEPPADGWLTALERCQTQGLRHRDGHLVRLDLHLVPLRRADVPVGWLLHVWQAPASRARFAARRSAERDLPQRLQALGEWSRRLSGTTDLAALRLCATQALRDLTDDPQARLLSVAEAGSPPAGQLLTHSARPLSPWAICSWAAPSRRTPGCCWISWPCCWVPCWCGSRPRIRPDTSNGACRWNRACWPACCSRRPWASPSPRPAAKKR